MYPGTPKVYTRVFTRIPPEYILEYVPGYLQSIYSGMCPGTSRVYTKYPITHAVGRALKHATVGMRVIFLSVLSFMSLSTPPKLIF